MTRNAETVEDHSSSVGLVERVEMNSGNIINDKIMALIQCVLNASAPDHLGIILARL
jgi:hypothetical protein